ncbi:hypothetical protein BDP81DRAFT_419788 [Colletotrichum phormii]|uniref:Uncharacterized protein n=1 Tax=Colletotrichum phormii TaxID=359342 RepID=A0AAI9ZY14_9PEZI|nr:uncharacterized protein BDP81DRAFT_419788 [Colletotrichum phormii]KAK1640317.1 hypothetical protein BDP81DRAFT_419788 [Colletotrichum phormii]
MPVSDSPYLHHRQPGLPNHRAMPGMRFHTTGVKLANSAIITSSGWHTHTRLDCTLFHFPEVHMVN